MRWLRPTVGILLWLSTSGIFQLGRALVWYESSTTEIESPFGGDHYPSGRDFQQRRLHIPALVSYSQYVFLSLPYVYYGSDTQILKAAKGVSTSYDALIELSNASNITLAISNSSLRFLWGKSWLNNG